MPDDEFKDIPGFPGYRVSRDGRIVGKAGRDLRPMVAHGGHLYVYAYVGSHRPKLYVHKAVLLAWIGPCPKGCECLHGDGDPSNNRVENIRWGTRLENASDKRRHGRAPFGERAGTAKLTEAQVLEIRRRVSRGASLRRLGAHYGVSHTAIRRAANGMKWAHLGRTA